MPLGVLIKNGEEILHALYVSAEFMQKDPKPPFFHLWDHHSQMTVHGIKAFIDTV